MPYRITSVIEFTVHPNGRRELTSLGRADDIETVKEHYEWYFTKLMPSIAFPDVSSYTDDRVFLEDGENAWFDVSILIVDASVEERVRLVGLGYDEEARTTVETIPSEGTIILFSHSFFAG